MRTATAASLGYLLLYLVSLFLLPSFGFVVVRFVAFALCTFVCTVAPPHHFVVFGSMCYTRYCVHVLLYELVLTVRCVLFKAANRQFPSEWKHPAASER